VNNKDGLATICGQSVRVFPEPLNLLESFTDEILKVNGEVILCNNQADVFTKLAGFIDQYKWDNIFCYDYFIKDNMSITVTIMPVHQFVDVEVSKT